MYCYYPFSERFDIYGSGEEHIDFDILKENADVIAKVKLNENFDRKIYVECILSEVEVQQVYKGNVVIGDMLDIFEPVNCTGFEGVLLCSEGYMPMEKGKEYILFLKQIKNALYSDSEYIYIPYNMTYGKYECNESRCLLFDADLIESGNLQYSNVNCEIMLSEKKMLDQYLEIKDEVWENF